MNRTFFYRFLLFLLAVPLPCMAMEQAPKTPSPKKDREVALSPAPSTPQRLVTAARINVIKRVVEAIQGVPHAHDMDEESFDPSFFTTSPQSFFKHMYQTIQENYSFTEKGITPEMIDKKVLAVQEALEADSFEKDYFEPMSSPLIAEAKKLFAGEPIQVHLLKASHIDDPAYAKTDLVVVNEEKLQSLAPTPRRRKALLKHEREHIRNKDLARKKALEELLEEQRIATAPSRQAALATPKAFSPDTKSKIREHTRIGETFADVAASDSPISAAAASRLWKQEVEEKGEGEAEEHPSRGARLRIAEASEHLHRAHEMLTIRKRQASHSQSPSDRKKVSRKLRMNEPEKTEATDNQPE